jgi:undecaprenyl-diphosphatase
MGIDIAVNAFMESMECPATVMFSKIIALIFEPAILIVFSLIVASYIYIKSSKIKGILFGVAIIITGIIIFVTKELFRRGRPLNALIFESSFSFPSGHAIMGVVFFGLVVYLFVKKDYKVWGIVVASLLILLIGLSRIYLRVHWFTDVFAGFVLGGIILVICIFFFRKIS